MKKSPTAKRRLRANGGGTVSKRKDDRWEVRWHFHKDGKLVRRSLYAKSRKEGEALLRAELHKRDQGLPSPHGPLTVKEYLTKWLDDVEPSLRPGSARRYRQLAEAHLIPFLGDIRLHKLNPGDLQRFYTAKLKEGLSPTTVRLAHGVLHKALVRALREEMVSRNVADAALVDLPRKVKHQALFLNPVQAQQALQHAGDDGDRLEALWITALMTGLRMGELQGLRWDAVDLDKGVVDVRFTLQPDGKLAEPKSASSRRKVPIGKYVLDALKRHQGAQEEERYFAANQWREPALKIQGEKGKALIGQLVFSTAVGQPLPSTSLVRHWQNLLTRSKLPKMPFHSARHTAASLMAEAQTSPKVAAERLGHSGATLTIDRYTHSSDTQRREAADHLEQFLNLADQRAEG